MRATAHHAQKACKITTFYWNVQIKLLKINEKCHFFAKKFVYIKK